VDISETHQIGNTSLHMPIFGLGANPLDPKDPATPTDREDVMVLWDGEQLYKGTEPVRPYFDFSRDGVMRSMEASLKRSGLDRFDALHIHDPDLYPDEAIDEAFRALADLKQQGVIGAIGCGMNQWEMLVEFADRAPFDCFLLAGRYSLLDQSALPKLLPKCERNKISLIIGGVYNSGILSPEHVDDNIAAFGEAVPMGVWADLKAGGFISLQAPAPVS